MSNTRSTKGKVVISSSPCTPSLTNNAVVLLESKLNEQREFLASMIVASEERIMERIGALAADITNLRSESRLLKTKVIALEKRCDNADFVISQLQGVISSYENNAVSTDVILFNIPNDVVPADAFNNIVGAVECEPLVIQAVFRSTKHRENTTNNNVKNNNCIPIIVKLQSAGERSKLFRAIARYKKTTKRQLSLKEIGITGESVVFVHECLSRYNRELLVNALRFKKSKLLSSVFTLRGHVYVRAGADNVAVKILNNDDLNKVVGGIART